MSRTSAAVCVEITRWLADGGVSWRAPSLPTVARTSFGSTYTPPLAMTLYACSICSAVTAMPWPMGIVAIDVPDQFCSGSMIPADSFGKPSEVLLPNPNLRR